MKLALRNTFFLFTKHVQINVLTFYPFLVAMGGKNYLSVTLGMRQKQSTEREVEWLSSQSNRIPLSTLAFEQGPSNQDCQTDLSPRE